MSILFDERVPEWEAQAMFDDAIEEAVATTKENTLIEVAKKFLKNNRPLSEIVEYTGLTPTEIESLQNA